VKLVGKAQSREMKVHHWLKAASIFVPKISCHLLKQSPHNKALHLTAIPLRYIAAGELGC